MSTLIIITKAPSANAGEHMDMQCKLLMPGIMLEATEDMLRAIGSKHYITMSTAPQRLLCSDYPELYAAIGNTYGYAMSSKSGKPSKYFYIPAIPSVMR